MNLARVQRKKRRVILGLNAGTSADGLDLAAVRVTARKNSRRISFLAGSRRRYPAALREAVLRLAASRTVDTEELIRVDNALGRFYGKSAASFISRLQGQGVFVDVVASHGQTIRHCPQKTPMGNYRLRGTLQLGSPDQIAAATARPVIADFRQADIALGNEGAPITVAAMQEIFAAPDETRLLVNVGGIANYFFFPAVRSGAVVRAADCGPGNSLCDLLASDLLGEPYDRRGRYAAAGRVSPKLLAHLLKHPFFRSRQVSTGREDFGRELVGSMIARGRALKLAPEDLLATAVELTAVTIGRKVQPLLRREKSLSKLYLTGGGEANTFLKTRLRHHLPGVSVDSVRRLGFDPGLVEATAFAVMAAATLDGRALRTRFGRQPQKYCPVPGRIVQPPKRCSE
jgi:anhydro-N-acetylmuramic acid kinase